MRRRWPRKKEWKWDERINLEEKKVMKILGWGWRKASKKWPFLWVAKRIRDSFCCVMQWRCSFNNKDCERQEVKNFTAKNTKGYMRQREETGRKEGRTLWKGKKRIEGGKGWGWKDGRESEGLFLSRQGISTLKKPFFTVRNEDCCHQRERRRRKTGSLDAAQSGTVMTMCLQYSNGVCIWYFFHRTPSHPPIA